MTKRKPFWSRSLSVILKGQFGNWCDKKMMRITLKRWSKKFGDFDKEKFDLTMKSRRYVSKHHPNDFQNKVLYAHAEQITRFKEQYKQELTKQNIEF